MKKRELYDFVPVGRSPGCAPYACRSSALLVIAPHPDDDVIGMGGTMRLLADAGREIFSVYVTSGSSRARKGKKMAAVRRMEALAALKIVHARGAFFLNHASTGLSGTAAATLIRQFKQIIVLLDPSEIFIPSPFERHPTHLRVTHLALKALRAMRDPVQPVWGYSVWGGAYGLAGTRIVDISKAMRIKQRAIRRHASQMAVKPYDAGILGRNLYEGIFLETHARRYLTGAETFLDMTGLQTWPGLDRFIYAMIPGRACGMKSRSKNRRS